MGGHRSSRAHNLRLVFSNGGADSRANDHRPLVLHALGTPRERLLLSPLVAELRHAHAVRQVVVSVGREEDPALHGIPDLALADRHLELPEGAATQRFAAMLAAFERAIDETEPELVVVAGAADPGLAAALAAAKRGVALAHVESGVRHPAPRSVEIHRVLTDSLADTLLAPTQREADNLVAEGVPDTRVHVVGQTDADVLRRIAPRARARRAWASHGLPDHDYVLIDVAGDRHLDRNRLIAELRRLAAFTPVALRVHGHLPGGVLDETTIARLRHGGVACIIADRHLDRVSLIIGAGAVVTNIGAVQDTAAALGVGCFTLGHATDRPYTVAAGTNVLLGDDPSALSDVRPTGVAPVANDLPPWDGRAARRAAEVLAAHYVLAGERPAVARS
jgi:UDP-N-acetylglucosamine 2-epimerase (non-hydrolysing)